MIFKDLNLDFTNIEKLLSETSEIIKKVPIDFALTKIRGQLPENSPILNDKLCKRKIYNTGIVRGITVYFPFAHENIGQSDIYSIITHI